MHEQNGWHYAADTERIFPTHRNQDASVISHKCLFGNPWKC